MSSNDSRNFLFAGKIKTRMGFVRKLDYMKARMNSPLLKLSNFVTSTDQVLITEEYKYSPDLVSYDYYGEHDSWWIICRYSGILNVLDPVRGFVPGRVALVPNASDLERWKRACRSIQVQASSAIIRL